MSAHRRVAAERLLSNARSAGRRAEQAFGFGEDGVTKAATGGASRAEGTGSLPERDLGAGRTPSAGPARS